MAVVAVLVFHRVSDLAGKVADVLLVLGVICGIGPDVPVAIFASYYLWILVPVIDGLTGTM